MKQDGHRAMPVAILAGGLGTRLMPFTREVPKALMRVNGVPFIAYQLAMLAVQDFTRVVLCLGYQGKMIEDDVRGLYNDDLTIDYSYDGDEPLGTGGAIAKALPLLGSTFGVIYGDTYPLYDLERICKSHHNAITMAVRSPGQGNVDYAAGKVRMYSTRRGLSHGDAGFSVFDADAFEYWHEGFELSDVFTALSQDGCIDGYPVYEPVYEIGSHQGLEAFNTYVATR